MRIAVMAPAASADISARGWREAGHDVAFVARGRHLAAMRERGLTVNSATGRHPASRGLTVTDDPASARAGRRRRSFAVKLWDTESAADAIRPLVAKGGVVIPFQNGVESIERIGAVVGAAARAGRRCVHRGDDRRARRHRAHAGPWRGCASARCIAAQQAAAEALHAACKSAGIERRALGRHPPRAVGEVRVPRGVLRLDERRPAADGRRCAAIPICVRRSRRRYARRGRSARAQGIALADDFVAQQMKFADGLPAEMKSSMLNDLAAGNRLEAPWLCGAVARMAQRRGRGDARSTRRSTPP
mgnify:CR=1 FL=1